MNEHPLVTVNILSFNRKDELRNTLTKVYEQDYKNIEVIVVDNASDDGSAEMVKNEFPSVQLIQMEKNIGIAGWNEGFKVAKGEYVLVLDDDSYPDSKTIIKGMEVISEDEKIAIIAFNVYDVSRNKSQTSFYKRPYRDFVGCGAIIKRSVFSLVNGFDPSFFIYVHELDFSIRVLDMGFKIEYNAEAYIFHRTNSKNKEHPINNSFRFYYQTLSYTILLQKYLVKRNYVIAIMKILINRFLVALYFGRMKEYMSLIKYLLFFQRKKYNRNHIIISNNILKLYHNLRVELFSRGYFGALLNNKNKISFPFLYLSTIFLPIEDKNLFIE
jgi:GT2 family glycosyltransferase